MKIKNFPFINILALSHGYEKGLITCLNDETIFLEKVWGLLHASRHTHRYDYIDLREIETRLGVFTRAEIRDVASGSIKDMEEILFRKIPSGLVLPRSLGRFELLAPDKTLMVDAIRDLRDDINDLCVRLSDAG